MENHKRRINYLTPDVQQYFKVPDKGKSLMQNENLAGFMVLLLQILDHESPSYSGDQLPLYTLLQNKLTFLHTFLGDTPFRCIDREDIKNVLVEFESLANEAGSFVYSCVSATNEVTRNENFDGGIHFLLGKVEALNAIIKELCFEEIHETTPTSRSNLRSAFIVESLVKDIEGLLSGLVGVAVNDIEDLIRRLVEELNFSEASVKDVEVPQVGHTNELRESLVDIIEGATYEAEYLINSYTTGLVPSWYLNRRLPVIIQKIKLTRTRLQGIDDIQDAEKEKIASNLARDMSFKEVRNSEAVLERVVIGFDDVTEKILEDLTGESKLQIISVFGMPGSGKTTLAMKLYDDPLVRQKFYLRMWCIVSKPYVKKKVFRDILTSLRSNLGKANILEMDDDSLGTVIYQSLKANKYLIVIDDIWDSSTWEDFRKYFPDDGNGSRILFTSRIKDSVPDNSIFHSPPALLKSQCYDLLVKKVFKNDPCPPVLSSIAEGIASKCNGLPLAVVVVAGILANLELDETTWKSIKGNLDSYIDDSGIAILELSYEHLPNRLKPCFLYLGAFSRNEEIVAEKLIPMWIAQGFVHKEECRSQECIGEQHKKKCSSQECIGEQYLLDLIDRSLLKITKRRSDGRVKSCRFHDLLHDMCLKSGNKEKFMNNIDVFSPVYQKYSHLALYPLLSNTCSISAPHCRSISGFIPYLGHSVVQMPLLRAVKIFELSDNNVMDVMRRICGLIHLRYLSSEATMPQDICKLVNLEYLQIDTSSTVYAPSEILKMEKLRHIRITSEVVFDKKCGMSQITNNIKSLLSVCIRNKEDEKILKCSPHIQKLKCICNGLFPDLTTFTDLESLNVVIFDDPLRVKLTEINFPSNLKNLTLSGTCFTWEETSVIGRLPNLHVLKLLCDAFVGEEWETRDEEFQKLRFLKLCKIVSLQTWTTSKEHFPELQCLVLDRVSVEIPSDFTHLETLHTIKVHNCGHMVNTSATQIEEERQDYGYKDFTIITTGFDNEGAITLSVSEEVEEGENIIHNVSQPVEDERNKEDEEGEYIPDIVSQLEEDELLEKDGELDFDKEELRRAIELSTAEEDNKGKQIIDDEFQLEDDEVLAKALQESLDMGSRAPQFENGSFFPPYPFYNIPENRICAGCNSELMKGRSSTCMGSVWHPECFSCNACGRPIFDIQFSIVGDRPYHKSCRNESREEFQILRCFICKNLRADGSRIQSFIHPFWQQRYCPSHETDGTPRCSSCERFEVIGSTHLILGDGRTLCLECLESSTMDTNDAQSLYLAIRDFFEGLNMTLTQQFPLFLVEGQALGETTKGNNVTESWISGRCLFKQEGWGTTTPNINSEPSERGLIAIQVLYGHPRLWTGKTIVYFMMQAWLWLQGYCRFGPGVGEGICNVLAHMWLDAENVAGSSKKGEQSEFEKKLGEWFKHKIESDPRADYGGGFWEGMKAVENYGLEKTLVHIRLTGFFPS